MIKFQKHLKQIKIKKMKNNLIVQKEQKQIKKNYNYNYHQVRNIHK